MVLVNFITSVLLKILHILVSMQISLTTNVSKTTKNVQPDVTFIFTELFENVNSLV